MKTAVVTDSNSGMTQSEAKDNLFILPMPFIIGEENYYEDINLSQSEFYEKLKSDAKISTSQPSYSEVTELWNKVLKDYDELPVVLVKVARLHRALPKTNTRAKCLLLTTNAFL